MVALVRTGRTTLVIVEPKSVLIVGPYDINRIANGSTGTTEAP